MAESLSMLILLFLNESWSMEIFRALIFSVSILADIISV